MYPKILDSILIGIVDLFSAMGIVYSLRHLKIMCSDLRSSFRVRKPISFAEAVFTTFLEVHLPSPQILNFVAEIGWINCVSVVTNIVPHLPSIEPHYILRYCGEGASHIVNFMFKLCLIDYGSTVSNCTCPIFNWTALYLVGFKDSARTSIRLFCQVRLNSLAFSCSQLYFCYFQRYLHIYWDTGNMFRGLKPPVGILS